MQKENENILEKLLNEHEEKLNKPFIDFWIKKEIATFDKIFDKVYYYLAGKYAYLNETPDDIMTSLSLIEHSIRISRMLYIQFKKEIKGL